jgi:hypothetical protein
MAQFLWFISLISLFSFYHTALGQETHVLPQTQSYDSLQRLAIRYLTEHIHIPPNSRLSIHMYYIGNELKIQPCDQKNLEIFLPKGSKAEQATEIGIRCLNRPSWSVYLPIGIQFTQATVMTNQLTDKTNVSCTRS